MTKAGVTATALVWETLLQPFLFSYLKEMYKKEEDKLFSRASCDRKGVMVLNQKRIDLS